MHLSEKGPLSCGVVSVLRCFGEGSEESCALFGQQEYHGGSVSRLASFPSRRLHCHVFYHTDTIGQRPGDKRITVNAFVLRGVKTKLYIEVARKQIFLAKKIYLIRRPTQ